MERLEEDIRALIRSFGKDRAVIVGHDWGGAITWNLAERSPEMCEAIVVLNSPHRGAYARNLPSFDPAEIPPSRCFGSWYIYFFLLPWLPEMAIRAFDYWWARHNLRGWAVNKGSISDQRLHLYVQAMAQPGALTAGINYYRAEHPRAVRKRGTGRHGWEVPVPEDFASRPSSSGARTIEPWKRRSLTTWRSSSKNSSRSPTSPNALIGSTSSATTRSLRASNAYSGLWETVTLGRLTVSMCQADLGTSQTLRNVVRRRCPWPARQEMCHGASNAPGPFCERSARTVPSSRLISGCTRRRPRGSDREYSFRERPPRVSRRR